MAACSNGTRVCAPEAEVAGGLADAFGYADLRMAFKGAPADAKEFFEATQVSVPFELPSWRCCACPGGSRTPGKRLARLQC